MCGLKMNEIFLKIFYHVYLSFRERLVLCFYGGIRIRQYGL